jgi:hypothetical protein
VSEPASGGAGDAVTQIAHYLDRAWLVEGWLVLFDLRKEPT